MKTVPIHSKLLLAVVVTAVPGCTVRLPGELVERAAASREGTRFEQHHEERSVAPVPLRPSAEECVAYALSSSPVLEASYWRWRAAIEQIPQRGTFPVPMLTLTQALGGGMSLLEGVGAGIMNESMTNIPGPGKVTAAAEQALIEARAAGIRFEREKAELRSRVTQRFLDFTLAAELIRLKAEDAKLLRTLQHLVEARVSASLSPEKDLLRIATDYVQATQEQTSLEAKLLEAGAALNATMGRDPSGSIEPPSTLPLPTLIPESDEDLLAVVSKSNPELRALAMELRGKQNAIEVARLQYVPDLNLGMTASGSGSPVSLLGAFTLPLFRYQAIEGAIAQARAEVRQGEAVLREKSTDARAAVIINLALLKAADGQLTSYKTVLLPQAGRLLQLSEATYVSGQTTALEVVDSARVVIVLKTRAAELTVERENRVVALEALAGYPLRRTSIASDER